MLNLIPIGLASFMAFIDAFTLAGLKELSIGAIEWRNFLPISMLIYSLQPIIFIQSLKYESMTVMNQLWDVLSDLIVTFLGLFYFKEKVSSIKKLGLIFAFISIILLSYEGL